MKKEKQINSRVIKQRGKKKKRNKKVMVAILVPTVTLIVVLGIWVYSIFNQVNRAVESSHESIGREYVTKAANQDVNPMEDNVSILLIGVDHGGARDTGNHGLSDALILATLNKNDNSVKLLSIPRDSYVYVPIRDRYTKINHAHSYGGAGATIETVEHLLDVPIHYYTRINFDAFIDIVDVLDGVQVDVPYELWEMDSNDKPNAIHLLPGKQMLNGEEALAFARTRKKDNDLERGKRQQELLKAIVDRAVSLNTILSGNITPLIKAVEKNATHNMTFNDIISFANFGLSGKLSIETLNLSGTDLWTDAYYFQLDEESLAENKLILQEHLELEIEDEALTYPNDEDDEDNL